MPHRSDHDDAGDHMTQQSGYMPASDMPNPNKDSSKPRDTATQVKEKTREYGQKVEQQADAGLDKAAGGMESAADKVREKASSQGGATAEYGTKVADTMEKTAGYLREHDSAELVDDVEQYVRQHPMQALAGAIVGGFIIGRLLG